MKAGEVEIGKGARKTEERKEEGTSGNMEDEGGGSREQKELVSLCG